tara:strand:- start:44713 stop:44859 length:147 start_codon:yes stop_codon:yes gene_type:complete
MFILFSFLVFVLASKTFLEVFLISFLQAEAVQTVSISANNLINFMFLN